MTESTVPSIEYAGFSPRLYASLIDSLICGLLLVPILNILTTFIWGDTSITSQMQAQSEVITSQVQSLGENVRFSEIMQLYAGTMAQFMADSNYVKEQLFQLCLFCAVYVMVWRYTSTSPGKWLLRMKIVDATTGELPSFTQLIARFIGYIVCCFTLGLGFFWINFDKKKQGLHDKMAGTAVVKVRKKRA